MKNPPRDTRRVDPWIGRADEEETDEVPCLTRSGHERDLVGRREDRFESYALVLSEEGLLAGAGEGQELLRP